MNILFFTPHVALWEHTISEVVIAKAMSTLGYDVEQLTCGKAQNYCTAMTGRGLSPQRQPSEESLKICEACRIGEQAISKNYNFPTHQLSDYIEPDLRESCWNIVRKARENEDLDTTCLSVNVGRIALYELVLAHKKMSTEFTPEQWDEYEIHLYNALITLKAFSKYISNNQHDVIATYSPQYSSINAPMQYAIHMGIQVLFMENSSNLGNRLGTLRVWDWKKHQLVNPALQYWESSDHNLVTNYQVQEVIKHFKSLLTGQHFAVFSQEYSSSVDLRKKRGIAPEQKILLMTLSSYDEAYAALLIDAFPHSKVISKVFEQQSDWIMATLEWIKERPDLYLVIRVHPRDFPNKRENVRSEQSYLLKDILNNVPENVYVNWPVEGISLYGLLEDANVVLTGWSVTALESLILGIPVVTYDQNLPSYPADIIYTGSSKETYFKNIDKALDDGWSFKNVTNGFRWFAYNFITSTIETSGYFSRKEMKTNLLKNRVLSRIRKFFPFIDKSLDLLHWKDAIPGAMVLDKMLKGKYDSLPALQRDLICKQNQIDETKIVNAGLAELHDLLYNGSNLSDKKPGLSKNIRKYFENYK